MVESDHKCLIEQVCNLDAWDGPESERPKDHKVACNPRFVDENWPKNILLPYECKCSDTTLYEYEHDEYSFFRKGACQSNTIPIIRP